MFESLRRTVVKYTSNNNNNNSSHMPQHDYIGAKKGYVTK